MSGGIQKALEAVRLVGRVAEHFSGRDIPPGELLAVLEKFSSGTGSIALPSVTRKCLANISRTQRAHALISVMARWSIRCMGPDSVYREVYPFYRAICMRMGLEPYQRDTFRKVAFQPWEYGASKRRKVVRREVLDGSF